MTDVHIKILRLISGQFKHKSIFIFVRGRNNRDICGN